MQSWQNPFPDVIKGQNITIVKIGYVADTGYEDKLSTKFDQHKLLYRLLTHEGHDMQILPIILDIQGAVLSVSKGNDSTWSLQNQSNDMSQRAHI